MRYREATGNRGGKRKHRYEIHSEGEGDEDNSRPSVVCTSLYLRVSVCVSAEGTSSEFVRCMFMSVYILPLMYKERDDTITAAALDISAFATLQRQRSVVVFTHTHTHSSNNTRLVFPWEATSNKCLTCVPHLCTFLMFFLHNISVINSNSCSHS